MKNPLRSFFDYLVQDRNEILNSDFSEEELKRLNRSGWYHQLSLAPLTTLTIFLGLAKPVFFLASLCTHSIYLRYGARRYGVHDKINQIKNLENITKKP